MYKCIDISYDDQNASVRDRSKLEYTFDTIAETSQIIGGGGGGGGGIQLSTYDHLLQLEISVL